MMRLYDTLSKEKVPLRKSSVKYPILYYSCGPTVYDSPHIGNWIAFIRYDVLNRVMLYNGYDVKWIMNLTDVGHLVSDADEGEDKLEKGAKREGKSAWEIADFYIQDFKRGVHELNLSIPLDHLPRATDFIDKQIELIQILEKKGYTYVIDDGVYFDTSKVDDYGKLARLDIDDLKEGARVKINEQKRNKTDFALWKLSPKGKKRDMEWLSPWGLGFPGWHIECSAIAAEHLGEMLDIHAGGIDHIPVHHTNEIAQSEAAYGKPLANIWIHSNFLTSDGVKLSKSLGNSYTLKDICNKGFHPLDFRMLALQSHYRTQANFTWTALRAAAERRIALQAFADLRYQDVGRYVDPVEIEAILNEVNDALIDDLNTPQALSALSRLDTLLDKPDAEATVSDTVDIELFVKSIDALLGLRLSDSKDITESQKKMLQARADARKKKKWNESDNIRNTLVKENITILDTPRGQRWERIVPH